MNIQQHESRFLERVREHYSGAAKVEIFFDTSEEKAFRLSGDHRAMSIRLQLGKPEMIGKGILYPVELPAFGIYNPDRDGEMPEDAATGFMLRKALERTYRGAPVLLRLPTLWTPEE